jgi:hypothetical protein
MNALLVATLFDVKAEQLTYVLYDITACCTTVLNRSRLKSVALSMTRDGKKNSKSPREISAQSHTAKCA